MLDSPSDPYTQRLLAAAPSVVEVMERRVATLSAALPHEDVGGEKLTLWSRSLWRMSSASVVPSAAARRAGATSTSGSM